MILNMKKKIKNSVEQGRAQAMDQSTDSLPTDVKLVQMDKKASGGSNKNRLGSVLLSKLATQCKIKDDFDNREYRLVTGGDDGHVFFWNIPYDLVNEAKEAHADTKIDKPIPTLNKR